MLSRFTECDLWSITRHYRFSISVFGQIFLFLLRHNKVTAFLTWLRSFCPIFHQTVSLSCENLPVFVRYTWKQFAKLCWPVTLDGLWTLLTCAGHTTSWRKSCVYTLITHSSRPIKTRVLRCSLYNMRLCTYAPICHLFQIIYNRILKTDKKKDYKK